MNPLYTTHTSYPLSKTKDQIKNAIAHTVSCYYPLWLVNGICIPRWEELERKLDIDISTSEFEYQDIMNQELNRGFVDGKVRWRIRVFLGERVDVFFTIEYSIVNPNHVMDTFFKYLELDKPALRPTALPPLEPLEPIDNLFNLMVWEWLKWIFGFFWNKRYGHVSTLLHSQTMCKYTKLGSISDTELIHASIDSFENVFGSCLYTIMDFNTLYQPVYHNVAPYHNTKHCNSTNSKIPEFIQNWFQRDVYEHKDIGFIYSSNGCMNLYWKGNRALLNVFKAKGGFGVVYPPYLVHEDLVEKFISGLVTWFDDDTFGDDTTIVNDAIDAIAIDTNTTTNTNNPTNKTNNKLTPKDLLKEE